MGDASKANQSETNVLPQNKMITTSVAEPGTISINFAPSKTGTPTPRREMLKRSTGIDALSPHEDVIIPARDIRISPSPIGAHGSLERGENLGFGALRGSPLQTDMNTMLSPLSPPFVTSPNSSLTEYNLFGRTHPFNTLGDVQEVLRAKVIEDDHESEVDTFSPRKMNDQDDEMFGMDLNVDIDGVTEEEEEEEEEDVPSRVFLPSTSGGSQGTNNFSSITTLGSVQTLNTSSIVYVGVNPTGNDPLPSTQTTLGHEQFLNESYFFPDHLNSSFGEHPQGEHPSRTLFVRNINSNVEDEELRNLFEQHGSIRSMYTTCKHRGFVMISYYDIRHAKNAMRHLQSKVLRRRKLDIHYSIPKENPSEKDQNQGTLVVFNLDPATTNEELKSIFETYGEIKEVRETPNKKHHKFVEFFDVRDAEKAMKNLNKYEIRGKKIKIEASRPGGMRKGATTPVNHFDDETEENKISQSLEAEDQFHKMNGWMSMMSVQSYPPPSQSLPNYKSANNTPQPLPNNGLSSQHRGVIGGSLKSTQQYSLPNSQQFSSQFSPQQYSTHQFSNQQMSHSSLVIQSPLHSPGNSFSSGLFHSTNGTSPSQYLNPPNGVNGIMNRASSPAGLYNHETTQGSTISPSPIQNSFWDKTFSAPSDSRFEQRHLLPGGSDNRPTSRSYSNSYYSSNGSIVNSGSNGDRNGSANIAPLYNTNGDKNGGLVNRSSFGEEHTKTNKRSGTEEDKSKYKLILSKVGTEDFRTTLMIKNIPNKYNQKMLLAAVDEKHKGTYDFFYLPIDFKNKCNVGYAFINFTSCFYIRSFYDEFNNKKWERFNSEKVCNITYARIQGKAALVQHFQNSSLMVEDKKCRPIIFQTTGPNSGEPEVWMFNHQNSSHNPRE